MAKRNLQLVQDSVNGLETSNGVNVAEVIGAVTDNAIARFDGTTGAIQNSTAILSDGGGLSLTTPELITNGTFDTNISGWTAAAPTATASWVEGKISITSTANYFDYHQSFPTIIGKSYYISGTVVSGGGGVRLVAQRQNGTTITWSPINIIGNTGVIFTALDTTSRVALYADSAGTIVFDNISVKEIPLTLNGLPAVAATNIGADNTLPRWDASTGAIQGSGVVVDDSGNVGIGVTPSAWNTNSKALQIGSNGYIENNSNNFFWGVNYYRNISNVGVFSGTGYATRDYVTSADGTHVWQVSTASGAAGSPITWTTALTIPNTGGIQLPNTAIANATTLDWYEEATATLTATGMTTAPTGTGRFTRIGNSITISIPAITGTSNAATFTLTGVPTNFRPSTFRNCLVMIVDNGTAVIGIATIGTDGIITISTVSGAGFTASGIKGTSAVSCSYQI